VVYSQVIRINNGVSVSSLKDSRINLFNHVITPYTFALGIDYVKDKYWNLSTEVCYVGIGGLEKDIYLIGPGDLGSDAFIENAKITIREKNEYIQLNTTFRVKTSRKYSSAYLGIGPSVSLSVGEGKFENVLFSDYDINKFLYGVKSEIGINAQFANKLCAGINASYIHHFKNFAQSDFDRFACSLFTLTLMLGYEF
jgi:hypothetical protein